MRRLPDAPLLSDRDPNNTMRLVLLRQFAHRTEEPEIMNQVELHLDLRELGAKVDELAQQAYIANSSDEVLGFAREINGLLEAARQS